MNHRCDRCNLFSLEHFHSTEAECIRRLRAVVERDDPTFSLHNRRLRLIPHPDADAGEYVLVAGFGEGATLFTQAHNELAICFDDPTRLKLIELLQRGAEKI